MKQFTQNNIYKFSYCEQKRGEPRTQELWNYIRSDEKIRYCIYWLQKDTLKGNIL